MLSPEQSYSLPTTSHHLSSLNQQRIVQTSIPIEPTRKMLLVPPRSLILPINEIVLSIFS